MDWWKEDRVDEASRPQPGARIPVQAYDDNGQQQKGFAYLASTAHIYYYYYLKFFLPKLSSVSLAAVLQEDRRDNEALSMHQASCLFLQNKSAGCVCYSQTAGMESPVLIQ